MPSWKKVIISGSAAELSSVYAPSITGSLQGTASFAVTSSYALTSSFSLATSANQILAINKSGFTITKGTVVHLTGSANSSDTPYITTASYESDNLSANTLGIAAETIAFNSTGYITTEGVLTELNVTGFIAGQIVYLGAGGTITGSAPIAPLHSVRLGQVVRDSPTNNGSIYVRIDNGYEIGELHDVIDSTTTTSFGDLLVKSGSVWKTGKQLTGSYGLTGSLTSTGSINIDETSQYQQANQNVIYIAKGTDSLYTSTIGGALAGTSGSYRQTVYGYAAGLSQSGSFQTAIGYFAGRQQTGTNQTAVGLYAGYLNTSNHQTTLGAYAGYQNSGSNQTATGYQAGYQNIADYQTATGYQAGYENTGSYQSAYGYRSGYSTTASAQTAIGAFAGRAGVSSAQTAVGFTAGEFHTGSNQTAIGAYAGRFVTASNQTAVGYTAGEYNIARDQTAIGVAAGRYNTGSSQTAVGYGAGIGNSGSSVTQVGYAAGQYNIGQYQTALGVQAGYVNSGSDQTAVGYFAGAYNSGSDNTNIGYTAGYYIAGTGGTINSQSAQSVFLGSQTTAGGGNRTNQIVIGYNAEGIGSNSVVLGNSSILTTALRGFVGIGITTPTASLHINNTTTSASLLVEDNTNPDSTPFIIDATGNVGIGTTSPTAKLTVQTSGPDDNLNAMIANFGKSSLSTAYGSTFIRVTRYTSVTSQGAGDYTDIDHNSAGGTPHRYGTFGDTNIINGLRSNTGPYGNINFVTSGSTRMTITGGTSAGNVGIGTTTPTAKLEVNGDFKFGPWGGGALTFGTYQYGTDFDMSPITGPGGWARAHRIKTSDPSGSIFFGAHGTNTELIKAFWTIDTPESLTFNLTTKGIHLLKNGNVGIGITTPSASLHVNNTSTSSSFLVEDSTNPDNTPFIIDAAGNVGIGTTTPSHKLHLYNNAYTLLLLERSGSLNAPIQYTNSVGTFYAGISSNGKFTIGGNPDLTVEASAHLNVLPAGNVGIGTTTPLANLHVTGSAIISDSLTVGTNSLGATENTLTLGVPPAGGAGEGGQLLLSAAGGTYTTASMIDNYQNKLRFLRGTNAGSDAYKLQLDMHTGQMQLPNYNSSTAFSGTAAGYLAFDSSGNIFTVGGVTATPAGNDTEVQFNNGGALAGTAALRIVNSTVQMSGSTGVTGSLTTTNAVIAQANGAMYFRGGDDAELWDINVANTVGIYGQQDATVGSVKLGSGGGTISGWSSSIGIGTVLPNSGTLHVNGNVFATSFTGSFTGSLIGELTGTASFATTASFAEKSTLSDVASAVYVQNTVGSGTYFLTMVDSQNTLSADAELVNTQDLSYNGFTGTLSFFGGNGTVNATATRAISSSYATSASISQDTINKSVYTVGIISGSSNWGQSGDGTITLPTVLATLYDNAQFSGSAKIYTITGGISGAGGLSALTNNDTNYILINYNSGTPTYSISTTDTSNDSNIALAYIVYRLNNFVHVLDFGDQGSGLPNKINRRLEKTQRFARESGLNLSLSGSTGIAIIDSGVAWNGTNRQTIDIVNSSGSIFFKNYHSGGVWTTSTTGDYINNSYYDNGTDLTAVSSGKYLTNWYYRGQETNGHIYEVISSNQYDTVALAQLATEPSLPELVSSHAVLVGRIIVQSGSYDGIVESAFTSVFQATQVTAHNDLTAKQGGASNEYYHLSANQYNNIALTNTSNTFTANQVISGSLTVTGSYNSPSGNTIDSNALLQASLLYLSNNF